MVIQRHFPEAYLASDLAVIRTSAVSKDIILLDPALREMVGDGTGLRRTTKNKTTVGGAF